MAKIKYSALVQEMRNKLNGSVLSKNRYGNYVRNKTTPVNPQTSFQQNQRARLSSVSQAWGGITTAQRMGFADLADNHPFTDIFGDQKRLDGKAMFAKLNLNLLSAGQATLTDAPVFSNTPFIAAENSTASVANGVEVDLSEATVPAGYTMVFEATPPLPATINFVKNRYRSLGSAVAAASVADITTIYNDRFGAVAAGDVGKVVHIRAFLVDNTTGQTSIATETAAVVAS